MEVRLKRVYDPESPGDGFRVLVDKLWPRGIRKEAFHYDLWAKRIAPSTSLRVWYHGDPAGRWAEFRRKYLDELGSSAAMQDFLDRIRTYPDVTLLYASKNRVENHAVILKEFIKKNGEFTVNIALVEKGVPVLGVIYVPVRKELYFASSYVGAYKLPGIDSSSQPSMDEMKQRAIRLPIALAHQGVVVVASRSHQTEETTAFIDNLRKQGKPVTLISSGSSLKICLVAEGSADIYPRFAPTMEWDTAAGHAIARAAGCEVYHIDGKTPLKYNKEDLHNPWFIVKPL